MDVFVLYEHSVFGWPWGLVLVSVGYIVGQNPSRCRSNPIHCRNWKMTWDHSLG